MTEIKKPRRIIAIEEIENAPTTPRAITISYDAFLDACTKELGMTKVESMQFWQTLSREKR